MSAISCWNGHKVMNAPALPHPHLLAYAAPALALAMPTLPVYVFLPAYYAQTVGLGLAATGAALMLARVFDVVTDPVVGYLSDRVPTRWGQRKPWMVLGGMIAAPALIALVSPPPGAGQMYLALWSLLLSLGWTLIAVPYTAWGADLSRDQRERTRITGWREGSMVAGILLAGLLPVLLEAFGADQVEPMQAIAWLALMLGSVSLATLVWMVPEARPDRNQTSPRPPLRRWHGILGLWNNGPFMRLLIAWCINGLANGLPAATFLLYLDHGLQTDEMTRNGLLFAYFLATILALPLWAAAAARWGKPRSWSAAMAVAVLAFAVVPFLAPGDELAFLVICLLTGAALGADLALPPAMQADVVDFDTWRTGERRAGIYFALWSMASKLSLALAVGLGLPLLEALGFTPSVEDGPDPVWPLLAIYAGLPVMLKTAAIVLIWHHPLTPRRHRAIVSRLIRRQSGLSGEGSANADQ